MSVIDGDHHEKPISIEICDNTAANGLPKDANGKRKAVIGFCKASMKNLSLALPLQSLKKDLCREEELTIGIADAYKENKKPYSDGKKLSLGLKQPISENLASSSFQTSAKSDNNILSRKNCP